MLAGSEDVQVSLTIRIKTVNMFPMSHLSDRLLYLVVETANVDFSTKPLSSQCLDLMQETQERYSLMQDAVTRDCENLMEHVNLVFDEYDLERMAEKRQFDQEGCKPNVTKECKISFLGFFSYALNLPDDEDLKKYYAPINKNFEPHRYNDFLYAMHPIVRDPLNFIFA